MAHFSRIILHKSIAGSPSALRTGQRCEGICPPPMSPLLHFPPCFMLPSAPFSPLLHDAISLCGPSLYTGFTYPFPYTSPPPPFPGDISPPPPFPGDYLSLCSIPSHTCNISRTPAHFSLPHIQYLELKRSTNSPGGPMSSGCCEWRPAKRAAWG